MTTNNPHPESTVERTLFHGATQDSADALLKNGWTPHSGAPSGNRGQTRYLYLSTDPEDALWFAQEKGGETILKVHVALDALAVDPEDGVQDTLDAELNSPLGLPGKVVATQALPASAFSLHEN